MSSCFFDQEMYKYPNKEFYLPSCLMEVARPDVKCFHMLVKCWIVAW